MGKILTYAAALGEDLAHVRVNVSGFALVGEVAVDELHEAQCGLPDIGFILGGVDGLMGAGRLSRAGPGRFFVVTRRLLSMSKVECGSLISK